MISSRAVDLPEAVNFDPFQGDDTLVTGLSDKIVIAAKDHARCQICEAPICKGERHRAKAERNEEDHKIMTFRFCNKCTRAMAHPDTYGTGRLIDSRYAIGSQRRRNDGDT